MQKIMKTFIDKNIKKLGKVVCNHDYQRLAFYHIANKEVLYCVKCKKRKTIIH